MVNKESLAYELGVLFFNLTSDEHIFSDNYDKIGNFIAIMNVLYGEIDLEDLKYGFFAEAQNRNINEKEIEELFERAKQQIEEY